MKHITVSDGCWNANIVFVWNVDEASFTKFMRKKLGVDYSGEHTGDGYFSYLTRLNAPDLGVIAMSDEVFAGTPYQYSVLAHECFHAAFKILKARGIRYSKNSEECFTYFADNLIETIATKALAYEAKHAAQ